MQLDDAYRLLFVLHYVEGYSVKKTTDVLNTTQGAVRTQLFRARAML